MGIALAGGGFWFTAQQNQTSLQLSQQQHNSDQQRALDQQRATILQTYIDNIQDLLLNHNLLGDSPKPKNDADKVTIRETQELARARTLTALQGLDPQRKGALLQFLHEAQLINTVDPKTDEGVATIIDPSGAYLDNANLYNADLSGADLDNANLYNADLSRAKLFQANISYADLRGADLRGADLRGAHLRGTNLYSADLYSADLRGADLGGALVTQEQLAMATVPPDVAYSANSIFHAFQDAGLISDPYPGYDTNFCNNNCDYRSQAPPRTWLASKNPYIMGEIATFSTPDAAESDQQKLDQAGYHGIFDGRCLLFWHGNGTLSYLADYIRIMESVCI